MRFVLVALLAAIAAPAFAADLPTLPSTGADAHPTAPDWKGLYVGSGVSLSAFKGAKGQEIVDKICATCWREWIPMGTKVINELRLPLSDPMAQKMYDQHMMEFLNLH